MYTYLTCTAVRQLEHARSFLPKLTGSYRRYGTNCFYQKGQIQSSGKTRSRYLPIWLRYGAYLVPTY